MQQKLLIEKVRQYEFLYNVHSTDYRDLNMRHEAWEEIGRDLKITASQAKDTWSKLRNCYSNALKRRNAPKTGEAAKKYVPWKYEMQMAFLQPYIDSRQTHSNLSQAENASQLPAEEFHQIFEDSELENTEEHESIDREAADISSVSSPSTNTENTSQSHARNQQPPQRKKRPNPVDEIVQIMKKKSDLRIQKVSQRPEINTFPNNLNETDMFYLSMSKTVQKLPPLEQVRIRMELCRLVSEAEISQLKSLNDNQRSNNQPTAALSSQTRTGYPSPEDHILTPTTQQQNSYWQLPTTNETDFVSTYKNSK